MFYEKWPTLQRILSYDSNNFIQYFIIQICLHFSNWSFISSSHLITVDDVVRVIFQCKLYGFNATTTLSLCCNINHYLNTITRKLNIRVYYLLISITKSVIRFSFWSKVVYKCCGMMDDGLCLLCDEYKGAVQIECTNCYVLVRFTAKLSLNLLNARNSKNEI